MQPDRVDPRKDQKLGKAKFNEKSFGRCNLKTFLQRVVATPYTLQVYNYRRGVGRGWGVKEAERPRAYLLVPQLHDQRLRLLP